MFSSPRIIAVDDIPQHLEALVNGLHRHGVGCLPIHYPSDMTRLKQCPNLRVLFADLNLMAGGDDSVHFATIGGLIETDLKPLGPYLLVLWTEFPDRKKKLLEYLDGRLKDVATPFDVVALDKSNYFDGQSSLDSEKLFNDISNISNEYPEFSALLDWEDQVLGAAGDTVGSVLELAKMDKEQDKRREHVSKLLYNLAVAGAGPHYFEADRFAAINGALLPVLADRISFLKSSSQSDLWQSAFDPTVHKGKLPRIQVAKLNRLVHIAAPTKTSKGDEHGAVIAIPVRYSGDRFLEEFGVEEAKAASDEFFCRNFSSDDFRFRWVLVQAQPACDYALKRPGTLPFYLGLELPAGCKSNKGSPPDSLWCSPAFESQNAEYFLHVSGRFPVSISKQEAEGVKPIYRLREQVLGNLIHRIHSNGSRPGIISFR